MERVSSRPDSSLSIFLVNGDRIRVAAPPSRNGRWQAPQRPISTRPRVIPANAFAPFCARNRDAPGGSEPAYGSEDCLFLNVYAPANASSLPVLVWIRGGGYGARK